MGNSLGLFGAWLMLHKGGKAAGWPSPCVGAHPPHLPVHSGSVSLLLPGVAFCERPAISKPSSEPVWRGLCAPLPAWKTGAGLPEGGPARLGSCCWPWLLSSAACSPPARPGSTVAVSWPECFRISAWRDTGATAWLTVRTPISPSCSPSLLLTQGLWPWEPLFSFFKSGSYALTGGEHPGLG